MNTTLIFATNNRHKVQEIRKIASNNFDIITLKEAGILLTFLSHTIH